MRPQFADRARAPAAQHRQPPDRQLVAVDHRVQLGDQLLHCPTSLSSAAGLGARTGRTPAGRCRSRRRRRSPPPPTSNPRTRASRPLLLRAACRCRSAAADSRRASNLSDRRRLVVSSLGPGGTGPRRPAGLRVGLVGVDQERQQGALLLRQRPALAARR